MNQLIKWSQGNPGAMVFLMELMKPENAVDGIRILSKLEHLTSIRGTNLYVLHSDLCNKDIPTVSKLITNCPPDVLEDACARQDYSGRKLVADYLA